MHSLLRKYLLVFLMSVFVSTPGLVFAYTSPGVPSGYVNDFVDVLTPEQEAMLSEQVHQHKLKTSNEVAIVTISTTGEDTIEEYAVKLFEDWGIGKDKEDNGVLLLLAIQDHKLRIEVGYGLEPILTDAKSTRIISGATPFLKQNNYDAAIRQMTDELLNTIELGKTESALDASSTSSGVSRTDTFIIIGVFLAFILFFFLPIFLIVYSYHKREGFAGESSGDAWSSPSDASNSSNSSSDSSSSASSSSGSSDSFSGGGSGGGGASGSW